MGAKGRWCCAWMLITSLGNKCVSGAWLPIAEMWIGKARSSAVMSRMWMWIAKAASRRASINMTRMAPQATGASGGWTQIVVLQVTWLAP
eukprot:1159841-Pelagomonas_calceolata.AAC.9